MKHEDMRDLAESLDDVIEKGEKLEQRDAVKIRKSISFNPMRPHSMGPNSPYYNPYRMLEDGSFVPHRAAHWAERGKDAGSYHEVESWYREHGIVDKSLAALRALPDAVILKAEGPKMPGKGRGVPVGTIHEWGGQKFQKVSDNPSQWAPVHTGLAGKMHDKKVGKHVHAELDRRAERRARLEEAIQKKKEEQHRERKTSQMIREHMGIGHASDQPHGQMDSDEAPVSTKKKEDKGVETSSHAKAFGSNLPADKGRLTHEGFTADDTYAFKAGKDLQLKDCEKFIAKFEKDFQALTTMQDLLLKSGASHFASRLKDRKSLLGKMNGRLAERSLSTVTDIIGARGLARTIEEQKSMAKAMYNSGIDILEDDNRVEKRGAGGYRAHHMLFRTPSGKVGELQLKTYRQQMFSGYTHDGIYKGAKEVKEHPDTNRFVEELSDYLYALDMGKEDVKEKRPVEPEVLKNAGLEFPWDMMDEFGIDIAKEIEREDLKFYAIIRSGQPRKNESLVEFSSFKDAKAFRDRKYSQGFDGEIPLSYAGSVNELVETFTEYRPEGWEKYQEIHRKVRRQKKGKGKEIKISKDELMTILKYGKYAMISAGRNPNSEADAVMSDKEVAARHKKLKEELIKRGYTFTPAKGKYKGAAEDSFLIMAHDAEREDMMDIGKMFNQDSIAYGHAGNNEVIYTTGQHAGTFNEGVGYKEDPKGVADFYSEVQTSDGPVNIVLETGYGGKYHGRTGKKVKKSFSVSVRLHTDTGEVEHLFKSVSAFNENEAAYRVVDAIEQKCGEIAIRSMKVERSK